MKKTSDIRNQGGYAEVAGIKIVYNWSNHTNEPVNKVHADLMQNDLSIGVITKERDGRLYVSFNKPGIVKLEDQLAIIVQALTDADSAFSEVEQ